MTNAMTWILCRMDLPSYDKRVLISYASKNSNWKGVTIGVRSHTDKNGEHWNDDRAQPLGDNVEVYAWMPLPGVHNER